MWGKILARKCFVYEVSEFHPPRAWPEGRRKSRFFLPFLRVWLNAEGCPRDLVDRDAVSMCEHLGFRLLVEFRIPGMDLTA